MTDRRVVALAIVLTCSVACSADTVPAAQAAGLHAAVACSADGISGPVCPNVLELDWELSAKWQLLPAFLAGLKLSPDPVVDARRAGSECRTNPNGSKRKTRIRYEAPLAMLDFPMDGTKGRDFVVALFTSRLPAEDCWEARYGVRPEKTGNNINVVFFTTVQTIAAEAPKEGFDRVIGQWTTWALRWKTTGNPNYELDSLRTGAYVQCGYTHAGELGDLAFTTCDGARRAHKFAVDSVGTERASAVFTNLMKEVNSGNEAWRSRFGINPEVDPAWGRCGSMGCCAAY